MASYIPRRVKRAKQQIAVRLYEDQLAMLEATLALSTTAATTSSARHLSWCSRKTEISLSGCRALEIRRSVLKASARGMLTHQ